MLIKINIIFINKKNNIINLNITTTNKITIDQYKDNKSLVKVEIFWKVEN